MAVVRERKDSNTGFRPLLSPETPLEAAVRDGPTREAIRLCAGDTLGSVVAPPRSRRIVLPNSSKSTIEWLKRLARMETDLGEDILQQNYSDLMRPPREIDCFLADEGLLSVTDAIVASIDPFIEKQCGIPAGALHELRRQVFLLVPDEVSTIAGSLVRPLSPGSYVSCDNPILHLPLEAMGFSDKFNRFFLRERGTSTVGELAWQTQYDLLRDGGCDRRWISRIREVLNLLGLDLGVVELGTSLDSPGPGQHYAIPYFREMVRRDGFWPLIEMALGHFDGWRRSYLEGRYLELIGATQMARRCGKDPQMALTQKERVLAASLHPFRFILHALTLPVLQAMEKQGGVVHRTEIEELTGEKDIRHFAFAANAGAGREVALVWRADMVTARPNKEVLYRGALKKTQHRGSYGFSSGSDWKPANVTDELVLILYEAGKPLHAGELLAEYRARGFTRWNYAWEAGGGDESRDAKTRPVKLAVQALLKYRLETYSIHPGVWVHESALPVPIATLTDAVDWCQARLEQTRVAYTPRRLHQELAEAGQSHPELTPTLLGKVLIRKPEIVATRSKRLVHVDADPLEAAPLVDQLAAISIREDKLLTADDFCTLVGAPARHSRHSVKNALHHEPAFILATPYGFIHERALKWPDWVRTWACTTALEILPEDGEPMLASVLLEGLEREYGILHISEHVATWALRGILRDHQQVVIGVGPLVARKTGEGDRALLNAAIVAIIRRLGIASSGQIKEELASRYHCGEHMASYSRCMHLIRDRLIRLPFYLYVLASNADEEVLDILSRHRHRFKHGRWVRSGDLYTDRAMLLLGLHYRRIGKGKVADEVRRQLLDREEVSEVLRERAQAL